MDDGPPDDAPARGPSPWTRIAAWLAAGVILVLLVYRTSPRALLRAASGADRALLAVAAAIALACEIFLATTKYQRIVASLGARLSWWETVMLRMGTYPVRNLLPLKSGEVLRVSYLKRCHGLPYARGALAALLDALTHAAALGGFVVVGLAIRRGRLALVAGLAAVAVVAALAVSRDVLWPRLAARLEKKFGSDGARGDIRAPWRTVRSIAGWTFLAVAADLLAYGLVVRAFHVPVPLADMALFIPVIDLAAGLSVTPMGFGVREAAVSLLLSPYGRPEALLATALVASAVMKLVPTLTGFPFLRPLMQRLLAAKGTAVTP